MKPHIWLNEIEFSSPASSEVLIDTVPSDWNKSACPILAAPMSLRLEGNLLLHSKGAESIIFQPCQFDPRHILLLRQATEERRNRRTDVNVMNESTFDVRGFHRLAQTHHPGIPAGFAVRAVIEEAIRA
jgi:hypothetical protein